MHGALSIYVHYPYCSRICSFCNFNKYLLPKQDQDGLLQAYQTELSSGLQAYDAVEQKTVRSVYFGGGTPSLAPGLVPAVLHTLASQGFTLDADCEVTLEANPSSLPDLRMLSNQGVTRLSLGVQSLSSARHLAFFNREHDTRQAFSALERLAQARPLLKHGFTFDLLFGNPKLNNQHETSILQDLKLAMPFACIGGHLSLYELTVEHGTPLARQLKQTKDLVMPDQDARAEAFVEANTFLTQYGWHHYEVSSYAATSNQFGRHNFAFWQGAPLLGIGPGAHGRLPMHASRKVQMRQVRTRNIPDPKRWAHQVTEQGHGCAKRDVLEPDEFADELITLGLRTSAGVLAPRFSQLLAEVGQSTTLEDYLDMEQVKQLTEAGLIEYGNSRETTTRVLPEWQRHTQDISLRATDRGRLVLDTLLPYLLKS